MFRMTASLPRLSDGIQKRRLSALHGSYRSLQCRAEIFRIRDRPFCVPTHALRKFCEVYIGIDKRRTNARIFDSALMAIGHPLDVHDLLMVSAIVSHYRQERNSMMRRRPKYPVGIHKVTIVLHMDV